MKIKITILFILILGTFQSLMAQDRIYLADKTVVDVRIEKVEENVIVYYEMKDEVEVKKESYADPALYEGQGKRSLKIHLLAPLLGHTSISYEQNLKPGRSLEYTLGIIGLGNSFRQGSIINSEGLNEDVYEDQAGAYLAVGYRKYSEPMLRSGGKRYKHLLQGWYFMPKVIVGYYKKNENVNRFSGNPKERTKNTFANLMVYGGKQIVFSESILLDWQIGAGVGFDSDSEESSNHYTVFMVNSLAIGGGVRIGFVF
jgi:hypothetical protein